MWEFPMLGTDFYHIVHTFILYSFFGCIMECIVLTIETKKLVKNRGFMKGPFCVIYGFAALILPVLLRPFSHNWILLFVVGMVIATTLELLTGLVMIRLFGSLWWDYSEKPFNYRGILCLESSLGWGLLSVLYFTVIEKLVNGLINSIPLPIGKAAAAVALVYFPADFFYHLYKRLRHRPRREETAPAEQDDERRPARITRLIRQFLPSGK